MPKLDFGGFSAGAKTFGERFLVRADLDLGRRPMGDRQLTIHAPGGACKVHGLSAELHKRLSARFEPFLDDGPSVTKIEVFSAAGVAFRPQVFAGRDYATTVCWSPELVTVAGPYFTGHFVFPSLSASLWVSDGQPDFAVTSVENFLRYLLAYSLVERGGFALHSSAVCARSGAWMFFGPSGAGKSTVADMLAGPVNGSKLNTQWADFNVINDDLNAVYQNAAGQRGWRVESIPTTNWTAACDLERAGHLVMGVYSLHQATTLRCERVSASRAALMMARCCPYVAGDPHRGPQLLQNLADFVATIPCHVLDFARDSELGGLLVADR
jgi:hypothetical protein